MESIGSKASTPRLDADDPVPFDNRSVASSDDWDTPHKPRSRGVENPNGAVLFHGLGSGKTYANMRADGGGGEGNRDSASSPSNSHGTHLPPIRNDSPGLFVSEQEDENDAAFVVKHHTHPKYTDTVLRKLPSMDGLERARALKAEIKDNVAVLQRRGSPPSRRRQVDSDSENRLITTLRQDQSMKWNDIANILNQERRQRGDAARLTEAAIYSRFVRSTTHTATSICEIGFHSNDYTYLRHPIPNTTAGKKRIKNHDNAKELEANVRKQAGNNTQSDLESIERTEQLMDAVAKVERNFWVFVADEMERSTTKLYRPQALEHRYHAL